jgi:hypothetical protein
MERKVFITAFTRARHLSFLSQINPVRAFYPISLKIILILFSYLSLDLPSSLLPSAFTTKTLYALLLSPILLHSLPISVFLTWSSEWYLVRNTDHPHYCPWFHHENNFWPMHKKKAESTFLQKIMLLLSHASLLQAVVEGISESYRMSWA